MVLDSTRSSQSDLPGNTECRKEGREGKEEKDQETLDEETWEKVIGRLNALEIPPLGILRTAGPDLLLWSYVEKCLPLLALCMNAAGSLHDKRRLLCHLCRVLKCLVLDVALDW